MNRAFSRAAACLGLSAVAGSTTPAAAHPGVDDARVEKAIARGVDFLRRAGGAALDRVAYVTQTGTNYRGLVLYTLASTGLKEDAPEVGALVAQCLNAPIERTYSVSCEAMAYEKLDRKKYRPQLAKIGQWLVDTQCANGQWGYGVPLPPAGGTTYSPSGSGGGAGETAAEIPLKRTVRQALPAGDNSASQYALLGLRACYDARVVAPAQTYALAERWWAASFHGKNGYDGGWGYSRDGKVHDRVTGTMTAGAIGSIAIARYCQKQDPLRSIAIQAGALWLTNHFAVSETPVLGKEWHYYYLYALSRAGILGGIEKFGNHDWYGEGANFILGAQKADGSWLGDTVHNDVIAETCFAILFLTRATRPVTYTSDASAVKQ